MSAVNRKWEWVKAKPKGIPPAARYALQARLEKHAQKHWRQQCREVIVRFRGAFAYVDAFPRERQHMPSMTAQERARLDAIPLHLCRLRFLGSDLHWEYAFFKYSDEKYELSLGASGSFNATPEQAFDCSARIYLMT